jgi:hypothetical protein
MIDIFISRVSFTQTVNTVYRKQKTSFINQVHDFIFGYDFFLALFDAIIKHTIKKGERQVVYLLKITILLYNKTSLNIFHFTKVSLLTLLKY